jgi:hypothetical protein
MSSISVSALLLATLIRTTQIELHTEKHWLLASPSWLSLHGTRHTNLWLPLQHILNHKKKANSRLDWLLSSIIIKFKRVIAVISNHFRHVFILALSLFESVEPYPKVWQNIFHSTCIKDNYQEIKVMNSFSSISKIPGYGLGDLDSNPGGGFWIFLFSHI